jgi:hypothetical protein
LGAADGCALVADVPDGAAVVCVEPDACRGVVRHGPLFASATEQLSANVRKPEHDG